jgi:streptogramin lyase
VEIDRHGRWHVVLGGPRSIAIHDPASGQWSVHKVGMYPHSVAVDSSGNSWYNGHFTVSPELIGRVDAQGDTRTFEVPAHPVLATGAGGPTPYELRVAPNGSIWGSELQGDRVFSFDPQTERFRMWTFVQGRVGARRIDIDAQGRVWVPLYGSGRLALIEPGQERITEIDLPIANTTPYITRADHRRGVIWIGTGAGDVVFRYEPRSQTFVTVELPSTGALVRHMAVDERTGDVWLAYGASPGIPARVARVQAALVR